MGFELFWGHRTGSGAHIQDVFLHHRVKDDGNEDVEEDGDQILQPIVILDQLPICKETKAWVRPPWPKGFPGKGLVGSSLDGDYASGREKGLPPGLAHGRGGWFPL